MDIVLTPRVLQMQPVTVVRVVKVLVAVRTSVRVVTSMMLEKSR